jgi:hypothetical protein
MRKLLPKLGGDVRHFEELRLWRQNAGKIKIAGSTEKEAFEIEWGETPGKRLRPDRWFAGLPTGAADLGGILGPNGLVVQVEIKAPKEKQKPSQRKWQHMIEGMGGLYVVLEYDGAMTMEENLDAAYAEFWRVVGVRLRKG